MTKDSEKSPSSRIQLIPPALSLTEQVTDYYRRNRSFLESFEPAREERFFTSEYQREVLREEIRAFREKTATCFYIKLPECSEQIIGMIALNNILYGAFCSAYLGYKLDSGFINKGCMTAAVEKIVNYAFRELCLHRIEANVMPENKASIRVLEKNQFVNEGISKHYLKINGLWRDHIHMVKINYEMHEDESSGPAHGTIA